MSSGRSDVDSVITEILAEERGITPAEYETARTRELALRALRRWQMHQSDALADQIIDTAEETGMWNVWLNVFEKERFVTKHMWKRARGQAVYSNPNFTAEGARKAFADFEPKKDKL